MLLKPNSFFIKLFSFSFLLFIISCSQSEPTLTEQEVLNFYMGNKITGENKRCVKMDKFTITKASKSYSVDGYLLYDIEFKAVLSAVCGFVYSEMPYGYKNIGFLNTKTANWGVKALRKGQIVTFDGRMRFIKNKGGAKTGWSYDETWYLTQ